MSEVFVREHQSILAERARALARPLAPVEHRHREDHLVFAIGGSTYALDVRFVFEIARVTDVLTIPGVPPPFLGLAPLRSELLTLIDLPAWLASPARTRVSGSLVLVCGESRGELAIPIDEALDIQRIDAAEVTLSARQRSLGYTAAGTHIIDGAWLVHDPDLYLQRSDASP